MGPRLISLSAVMVTRDSRTSSQERIRCAIAYRVMHWTEKKKKKKKMVLTRGRF